MAIGSTPVEACLVAWRGAATLTCGFEAHEGSKHTVSHTSQPANMMQTRGQDCTSERQRDANDPIELIDDDVRSQSGSNDDLPLPDTPIAIRSTWTRPFSFTSDMIGCEQIRCSDAVEVSPI